MRCLFFVSERTLSRPKLTVELSFLRYELTVDRAMLASTLWSAVALPASLLGRWVVEQSDLMVLESLKWKLRRLPRWMYLQRGWRTMSGWGCRNGCSIRREEEPAVRRGGVVNRWATQWAAAAKRASVHSTQWPKTAPTEHHHQCSTRRKQSDLPSSARQLEMEKAKN